MNALSRPPSLRYPAARPAPAPPADAKPPALRVGLLGGSFNPAHEGHRYVSTEALKRLALDQVWWLVSPQNPLKASGRHGAARRAGSAGPGSWPATRGSRCCRWRAGSARELHGRHAAAADGLARPCLRLADRGRQPGPAAALAALAAGAGGLSGCRLRAPPLFLSCAGGPCRHGLRRAEARGAGCRGPGRRARRRPGCSCACARIRPRRRRSRTGARAAG